MARGAFCATYSLKRTCFSINRTLAAQDHYRLGRALAPLRARGILIVASGNVIHNLREYAWDEEGVEPYDRALRFEIQGEGGDARG